MHERRAPAPAGGRSPRRRPRPSRVDPGHRWRRALAACVAVAELVLLGLLLFGPYFRVQQVRVEGNRRVPAGQVAALAGLGSASLFAVDPGAAAGRVGDLPWIRTVSVGTSFPDGVTIRVEEWQPVAAYHPGSGRPWYLSDQAVALGPEGGSGQEPDGLVQVQGPGQKPIRQGQQVLDARLLVALVNIQRDLPDVIGQDVRSFQLDSCGNLTMVAGRGWKAQFGRVLTPEEFASLRQKVAALKAVSAKVNYNSSDLDYVNVMNPTQVAVMNKSSERALAAASPRPSASPSPRASPNPAASPSPRASPNPAASPSPAASAGGGPVVIGPSPGGPVPSVSPCR
jgi:cell division septal protein FtsQ